VAQAASMEKISSCLSFFVQYSKKYDIINRMQQTIRMKGVRVVDSSPLPGKQYNLIELEDLQSHTLDLSSNKLQI